MPTPFLAALAKVQGLCLSLREVVEAFSQAAYGERLSFEHA